MTRPIKSGDLCEVVGGLGQRKSPNLGLRVTVVSLQGEHSRFGRIWRCAGDGVMQLSETGDYVVTGVADFSQDWLRLIEPPDGGAPTLAEQVARRRAENDSLRAAAGRTPEMPR